MDSNTPEKKPKRPRIGQTFHSAEDNTDRPRYDRPYNPTPRAEGEGSSDNEGYRSQRPYQPRQGGYQPASGWIYQLQPSVPAPSLATTAKA